jgi:hypothetical protein
MHWIFFHISMKRWIWIHLVHLSSLTGYGFAGCQNQTNKRICTTYAHKVFHVWNYVCNHTSLNTLLSCGGLCLLGYNQNSWKLIIICCYKIMFIKICHPRKSSNGVVVQWLRTWFLNVNVGNSNFHTLQPRLPWLFRWPN